MNKFAFALDCSAALQTSAYSAPADCPQGIVEVERSKSTDYFVEPVVFDDRLEVFVNGTLARTWHFNQDRPEQFKLIFRDKRVNEVRFVGINRPYQPYDHDRNPGCIAFHISATTVSVDCVYAGSWELPEVQTMLDHTYKFIDPSMPN